MDEKRLRELSGVQLMEGKPESIDSDLQKALDVLSKKTGTSSKDISKAWDKAWQTAMLQGKNPDDAAKDAAIAILVKIKSK